MRQSLALVLMPTMRLVLFHAQVGASFLLGLMAHNISALMEHKDLSLLQAVGLVIYEKVPKFGGSGGIVVVDKNRTWLWNLILQECKTLK
jgi:isoaspartyl peptidase/L-asparaginase-like protein (Ntn-hydrolase superfamily)